MINPYPNLQQHYFENQSQEYDEFHADISLSHNDVVPFKPHKSLKFVHPTSSILVFLQHTFEFVGSGAHSKLLPTDSQSVGELDTIGIEVDPTLNTGSSCDVGVTCTVFLPPCLLQHLQFCLEWVFLHAEDDRKLLFLVIFKDLLFAFDAFEKMILDFVYFS